MSVTGEQVHKLCIWMNMPSHHQRGFLDAIFASGVDLQVRYYGQLTQYRKDMGWGADQLQAWEQYVDAATINAGLLQELGDYVHIVPGYRDPALRKLIRLLVRQGRRWLHWSEPAQRGLRWYVAFAANRLYASIVNRYAQGALAIGDNAAADFRRWGVDPGKIALLPYCVPGLRQSGAESRRATTTPVTFICVAALCHRKGIDILISAFASLLQRSAPGSARLLLLGPELEPAYRKRVEQSSALAGHVEFLGPVAADAVKQHIDAADVLVLASRFDGWGMVLNEAASLGLPLIATDSVGAAHHLIEEGVNGFRVPGGNADAFADAMQRYVQQPALADAHGEASLQVFERWTPQANAQRLLAILTALRSPAGIASAGAVL